MKKKALIIVLIVILLLILFTPIHFKMRDGRTSEWKALTYKISKVNGLNIDSNEYEQGIKVNILGLEVFNNIGCASESTGDTMNKYGVDSKKDENGENQSYGIGNIFGETIRLIVVKVNQDDFLAMDHVIDGGLYRISLKHAENIELKKDQEIIVHFDGVVLTTYPGQLSGIDKIEIVKEKSDIEIPIEIIKHCYNSKDNVSFTISELTNANIALTIKDSNEIPYDYSHSYIINKEVKNEAYTGVGYQIGESTSNSTAGYTGTGFKFIWEEANRISDISSENTEYNSQDIQKDDDCFIINRCFNWNDLYGRLEAGKYEFILESDDAIKLKVSFTIDDNGNVSNVSEAFDFY